MTEAIKDTKKIIDPEAAFIPPEVIPEVEIKSEDLLPADMPGKIIQLGKNTLIWGVPSGKITLSVLEGNYTAEVPKNLTSEDMMVLMRSIRSGKVVITEKMMSKKESTQGFINITNDEDSQGAYIYLDCKNAEILKKLLTTAKYIPILKRAVEMEGYGKGREVYISLLRERIKALESEK